jgi:hypothetical protein
MLNSILKKMKKLSNLEGLQKLSPEAQKNIVGGGPIYAICPPEPFECNDPENANYCIIVNGCLVYKPN